jgi:hypothetical protein
MVISPMVLQRYTTIDSLATVSSTRASKVLINFLQKL